MSQQEEQHSPSRGVAVEVQDFYERYPYPRPIDSLEKYRRFGQDRQKRRVDYHLFWPVRPNQTHAYRDLIIPIDSTEKRLFDAIDGNCSIRGIVERTLPSSQTKSQLDMARTFFEKLWWYDQVVFDASRCRAGREET